MYEDEWATAQLAAARVPVPVGRAVMTLLESWENVSFPNDVQRDQALELFSQLARGEVVVEESEDVFVPVQVGAQLEVGDIVRVQSDAFKKPDVARIHNGRIGRVLAKRSGDIIVRSIDNKEPHLETAHYPANLLEKKIN